MSSDERNVHRRPGPETGTTRATGVTSASPRTNPINMALAELQGELSLHDSTSPAVPPASPPAAQPVPFAAASSPVPIEAQDEGGHWDPRPAPAEGLTSRVGFMLVAPALLSLIFGLIGAWAYQALFASQPPAPSKPAEGSPAVAESTKGIGPDRPTTPTNASAADLEPLKRQLDALTERLENLQKRFEQQPEFAPLSDVSRLRRQFDGLSKSTEGGSSVAKDVGTLTGRVDHLESAQKLLQDNLAAVRADTEKLATLAQAKIPRAGGTNVDNERRDTSKPIVEEAPTLDVQLSQGASLFKQGKFSDASTLFNQLVKTNPDDARVWYYAALSHGFATNEWAGEPLRLVEKGVERERAGTPPASDIDLAFQGLDESAKGKGDNGKKWLEFYRQRARSR